MKISAMHPVRLDAERLRSLMEQYGDDVWNYAYVITRNTHTADDVAQDVFLKAYRGWASFRGEASEKTWLLKITRNTALSYRKLAFFRRVILAGDRYVLDANRRAGSMHAAPSAESVVLDQETEDEVWRHVIRLPGKFRDPLVLSVHYRLSIEDISSVIGIPPGTVKSRIARAKAKVAASWKGAQDDE